MSTKYIASNWRLLNKAGVDSYLNDNYGLTFDGNEHITASYSGDVYACSIWFKPENTITTSTLVQYLISFGAQFDGILLGSSTSSLTDELITINNDNSGIGRSAYLNNGGTISSSWHHICFNWTGSVYQIWLDGVNVQNASNGTPALINASNIRIGKNSSGTDRYFDGSISEVSIFDYTLTESQISTLYGSSSLGAGNPMALKPQPVAFYPLGDNSASNPLTQPNEAVEDASVFDFGTSNYIEVPQINTTGAISISGWVKTTDTNYNMIYNEDEALRSGGNRNLFFSTVSSNLRLNIRFDTGTSVTVNTSGVTLNDGNWHHVAGVWNGTTDSNEIKLFVDGILRGQGTATETTRKNFTMLGNIGGSNASYDMNGQLSNIQTYTTGLSYGSASSLGDTAGGEIAELYNSGVPLTGTQPQASNLKAWYKLDQSANWEADSSGAWQIPDAVSAYPQSFNFDGVDDYINFGDSDDFSFGDGVTDSPFSISVWVNKNSGELVRPFNKYTSSSKSEYNLVWAADDRIFFSLSDLADANRRGRKTSAITSGLGEWNHIVATYDGRGGTDADDGIKIYLNKTRVDDAYNSKNNYTAMHNTNSNLLMQQRGTGYGEGKISNAQIYNIELSSSQVETLYNNGVPLTTAIASDNLKLWAKLNNTATFSTNWSIPDASGNGNTGTSSGMTEQNLVNNNVSALNGESSGMTSANLVLSDLTRAVPYDSYSFELDGANDYIDCGDSDTFSFGNGTTDEAFSISGWVYPDSNSRFKIVAKMGATDFEYQFGTNSTGKLFFTLYSLNSSSRIYRRYNSSITTGVWQHWAATYDGSALVSGLKIYINGVRVDDTSSTTGSYTAMQNTTATFKIGTSDLSNYANGKVSNVSIYNNELTSTEVMKLYSNGVPQDLANFTPAPVAWYPLGSNSFWNGSAWTVRDMSTGGSNDGTGQNIGIDGLVGDSPRSSANGTGTNMDVPSNLEGSTKWSSNNSWSINMSETARVEDTP